ncbi:MAG TPA: class I SAM-dependent methyltransferase [Gammaproteobacteria bacterium]
MQPTEEQAEAGQAVYTKRVLSAYDIIVLGISNRFIWKCPTSKIEMHYSRFISSNHLDVGVGTGYFLDRCLFPSDNPRLALMDMNPNVLDFASKRIERYRPETYRQNILEKISESIAPFDSVGVNYLLHCMPGAIVEKAIAFDHLKQIMNAGGCIFGSTILHDGVQRGWAAKRLMAFYNKKGIFSNTKDDLPGLKSALDRRFRDVTVKVSGCVGLFSGYI